MGTAVYSFWAGSRAADGAADGHSWAFSVFPWPSPGSRVWVAWHAIKTMRRSERRRPRAAASQPWFLGRAGPGSSLAVAGSTGGGS